MTIGSVRARARLKARLELAPGPDRRGSRIAFGIGKDTRLCVRLSTEIGKTQTA